jgi:NADH-quinone oxidoreductase subunit B
MAQGWAKITQVLDRLEGLVYIPWTMVNGCCAVEVRGAGEATYDWKRLGVQDLATHPSQADVLIVGGWISEKFADKIKLAYSELAGHRYVIAVGACALSGSPYSASGEKIIKVSDILPVDVYVPGCPPRPEAMIEAIQTLKTKSRPQRDQRKVIYEALKGPSGN